MQKIRNFRAMLRIRQERQLGTMILSQCKHLLTLIYQYKFVKCCNSSRFILRLLTNKFSSFQDHKDIKGFLKLSLWSKEKLKKDKFLGEENIDLAQLVLCPHNRVIQFSKLESQLLDSLYRFFFCKTYFRIFT